MGSKARFAGMIGMVVTLALTLGTDLAASPLPAAPLVAAAAGVAHA